MTFSELSSWLDAFSAFVHLGIHQLQLLWAPSRNLTCSVSHTYRTFNYSVPPFLLTSLKLGLVKHLVSFRNLLVIGNVELKGAVIPICYSHLCGRQMTFVQMWWVLGREGTRDHHTPHSSVDAMVTHLTPSSPVTTSQYHLLCRGCLRSLVLSLTAVGW